MGKSDRKREDSPEVEIDMGSFGLSKKQLTDLFDDNGDVDAYRKLGGAEGLARALHTSLDAGIGGTDGEMTQELQQRINSFGENVFPIVPPKTFFSLMFDALKDKVLIILMVAAVVSIILGVAADEEHRDIGWIEGFAILVAVVLVSGVTAGNDWAKERQFRKLNAVKDDKLIKVVRGGHDIQISIYKLLVGDLVRMETGDAIPADGVVVGSHALLVDESAMTGETDSIKKDSQERPFLLSGCKVMEGTCTALICAVGVASQWGKIREKLAGGDDEDTPLQAKLGILAENIGKAGLAAAIATLVSLLIVFIVARVRQTTPIVAHDFMPLVTYVVLSITILVVAIPEGLPLAVTIALAFSVFKMMKDQNLVRHLAACETMGGATNICSDKTGTLTTNRMTCTQAWIGGRFFTSMDEMMNVVEPSVQHLFCEGAAINSTAYIVTEGPKDEFIGSKTECALLQLASRLGCDYAAVRKQLEIVELFPFSSARKRMGCVVKYSAEQIAFAQPSDGAPVYRFYCKGAAEMVFNLCNRYLDDTGSVQTLGHEQIDEVNKQIEAMASSGLRTLCLTYKDLEGPKDWTVNNPESDLVCIAVMGIKDPVRDSVPEAVALCKKAGITVRMLTGDNLLTASHIARECGILTEDGIAITGRQMRELSNSELDAMLPKLQVVARCSPTDKYDLVHRLRLHREVVAATGDGTNDAPQLKEADVGFAMGIAGTEVAKDACDIILLSDDFAAMVKAVMWGRCVYESVRKFLQFQLTVNVVAVVIAYIGAVYQGQSPLKSVQLLWVNLIMDTMAALALATEPPSPELLNRPPVGRYEGLITWRMWRFITVHASYQLLVLLLLLFIGERFPGLSVATGGRLVYPRLDPSTDPALEAMYEDQLTILNTAIFNTFVWMQIFNEFNARKLYDEVNCFTGLHRNWIFAAVLIITVGIQTLFVQVAGVVLGIIPGGLNGPEWACCLVLGFIAIPLGMLSRLIPVPSKVLMSKAPPLNLDDDDRVRQEPDDDRRSLISTPSQNANATSRSKWRVAQQVRAQMSVVVAFRRYHR